MLGTTVNEGIVWFDGTISIKPELVEQFILRGEQERIKYVTTVTPEIEQLNKELSCSIGLKPSFVLPPKQWTFPREYTNFDVESFVFDLLEDELQKFSKQHYESKERIDRVIYELDLFKQHNMFNILYLMVYIVDTLQQQNICWGVGRGSSVSSYILYLIGVHDIDSVKYQLDVLDFFH